MNTLIQLESSLIGSEEAVVGLENAAKVSLLAVSDSHGNPEILEEIILAFGGKCDALVYCGDGAGDLMQTFADSQRNSRLASAFPPVIAPVRGNGDGEWYEHSAVYSGKDGDDKPASFRINLLPRIIFKAAGRTIFVSHGHYQHIDAGFNTLRGAAEIMDADLIFFGHTHRPYRSESGASLLLNPGSCSGPRGGFPPSFAIVSFPGNTENYTVRFFAIKKTLLGGAGFTQFTPANSV
ncbi:MAG: YfcE family phosphodiesterase [Treponema sp.]|jgi:putative phosphoesterase|nr:YfcE family phosphodiesterase [Treponema sp.]